MSTKQPYLNDKMYTYNYFCQGNVCRLCWSSSNSFKSLKRKSKIAKEILENIGIDVTTGIPNEVCNICLNKLRSFINFKKCCRNAEEKLKTILSQTVEVHFVNPTILKKEVNIELNLLAKEVKKEKLDSLIIKQEKDSNFEMDDAVCDSVYKDLLPKAENYCYICSLNFDSAEQITKHNLESHESKKVYKCGGCREEFTSLACKTSHEVVCTALNEFNCTLCSNVFPTYDSFRSHINVHSSEEKNKQLTLPCTRCPKTFKNIASFKRHLQTHYAKKKDDYAKKKAVCEVCGQVYSKSNMYVHMLIHTRNKQLKCPHCEYRATLPASLNTHIKLHTGERPYACDQCPYRCITSSNLSKHRKTHTGVKDYTCHICKKGYRHNASLRDHITAAHQGERKHKCKQCSAQYFHFKGLRKHMLVKHGQKIRKVKDDFVELDGECYTRARVIKSKDDPSQEDGGMSYEDGMSNGEAGISLVEVVISQEDA